MGNPRKRNEAQRIADQEFLVKLLNESKELNNQDYHVLLNEHIKEREGDNWYELSYPMVSRIISDIKQGYAKHTGLNIQQELLDTNDRLEYLISVAADELARRLVERERIVITTQDLDHGDISHLSPMQLSVLKTIELEVTKKKTTKEIIRPGVGVESIIAQLDSLLKSKRSLLGLDAPKKIEKQVNKNHTFQSLDKDKLIEVFTKLQLPTGPLLNYLETTFKKRPKIGEEINPENTETSE